MVTNDNEAMVSWQLNRHLERPSQQRTAASHKRAAEHAATRAKQAKVRRVHGVRESHGFPKTGWIGLSCGYNPRRHLRGTAHAHARTHARALTRA
ncbi:hypothetical protein OAN61_00415 [bacterium]|nr:hypothetical protein [bacterium]